jgi:CHAT domain-containing protein
LGSGHPAYAQSLANLAEVHSAMGHFEEAEAVHRNALEIRRKVLGPSHPDVAQSLQNLAWVHARTHRHDEALRLLHEAAAIDDGMLGQVFSIGSEKQRMAYLENVRLHVHLVLSLVSRTMATAPDGVRDALDLVLRRKAVALEVLAVQRDTVLAGRYPALEQSLRELSALRVRIARTLLGGERAGDFADQQPQLAAWEAERDRRERELARQIPELDFEHRLRTVDCQALASSLPSGACLVEFVRYFHFDLDTGEVNHARCAAFVLNHHGPDAVPLIDLGPAEPIERLIRAWRGAVTGRSERRASDGDGTHRAATNDVREIVRQSARDLAAPASHPPAPGRDEGHQLRALIFDPLVAALDGCRRLLIAPDGDLALVPFDALPVGESGHLIDDYTVSYLGAGRDLLRFASPHARAPQAPLVMSDPDYDLGGETVPAFARNAPFRRLEGGFDEGRIVAGLLGTTPMTGGEALESQLRGHRSPALLHVATHGFFAPYVEADRAPADGGGSNAGRSATRLGRVGALPNPMLRAGLALAGANAWAQNGTPPAEAEDGILTAEDVTGLDLLDTELVVLSACETGLGEVHLGEGLFGLQRAFTIAGASTLVMSLWKVPDRETSDLMARFYEGLVQGKTKIDALREAQLHVRRRAPDPFYWGAFVCQGEPGPLRANTG